jgi:hypothetical protein
MGGAAHNAQWRTRARLILRANTVGSAGPAA